MLKLLFRCQCGWEKTDHEYIDEYNTHDPWKPEDVILDKTNAYGEIEFHGAGKLTRAKVPIILSLSLLSREMFSLFSIFFNFEREFRDLLICAGPIFSI